MADLKTSPEPPIVPDTSATTAPNDPSTLRERTDPIDLGFQRWFVGGEAPEWEPAGGCEVIAYVHGANLFADMASAIGTATSSAHFVLVAGWTSDLTMVLVTDPGTGVGWTLPKLLEGASNAGAAVRALYYDHSSLAFGSTFDNGPMVAAINDLTNGKAIHDARYITFGSHHQKLLIVSGEAGLVAFVGGNDIFRDRFVIHDTHVRVRGRAAERLYWVFWERWHDHPDAKATPIPPPLPSSGVPSTNHFVQVRRTYPNGSANQGIDVSPSGGPAGYSFAPTGLRQIRDQIIHAIEQAQTFIYLEEQYLVSPDISAALAKALPRLSMLVILLCDTDMVNGELVLKKPVLVLPAGTSIALYYQKRREFLDPLFKVDSTKVHVFERTTNWMHSKAWIFDDLFGIVGTANVNVRGYTHDSEAQCGIFDPRMDPSRDWYWAHELRMNLWAKHLHVAPIACRDPIASLALWTTTANREVRAYDKDRDQLQPPPPGLVPDSPGWSSDLAWAEVVDPDGS